MRIARGLRARATGAGAPRRYDSWLEAFHGDRLHATDDACAGSTCSSTTWTRSWSR